MRGDAGNLPKADALDRFKERFRTDGGSVQRAVGHVKHIGGESGIDVDQLNQRVIAGIVVVEEQEELGDNFEGRREER